MEQAEMFKRNAVIEDIFTLTRKCMVHCGTINRSNLTAGDVLCLENCGYNRSFLNSQMKMLMDMVEWTQQAE